MTTDTLPPLIDRYFAAKGSSDAEDTLACFADDAIVWDNGEDLELRGQPAIREWMTGTLSSYELTSKVAGWTGSDDGYTVNVVVSGNFPGSPYAFDYRFKLSGDKISELAIDPVGPVNG